MALSFSDFTAHAMLNAITAYIAQGTGNISLKIYAGAVPAISTPVSNQPLLATLTKTSPLANAASGKALEVLPFDSQVASATGTATFFRLFRDNSEIAYLQGTITETGGKGDLTLNKVAITQGEPVSIVSMRFTLP